MTAVGLVLELSSIVNILGEDSTTISESVIAHKVNSLLNSLNSQDDHNGSEDLLIVDVHAWLDVINIPSQLLEVKFANVDVNSQEF